MKTKNPSKFVIAALWVAILSIGAMSQTKPSGSPAPRPAPGEIKLPEGYIYEPRRGKDSHVGAIVRSDGFTISHDIGRMAGNDVDEYFPEHFERLRKQTHLNSNAIETQIRVLKEKVQWRQRQQVNGDEVMVVGLKDHKVIACFVKSNANFAAIADTEEKLADFFLIVLTYQPSPNKWE